jgi:molybdate transport system substrate-binding protein
VRASWLLPLIASAWLAIACTPSQTTTVTVFAAASLSEPFRAIERDYEAAHPGVDLELSFAGSQLLAAQLLEGAPAQLFAAADGAQLDRVAGERALTGRRVFASNRLVIVVPAGSAITGVDDLAAPGVRIVLAGEAVPAGRYAQVALDQLGGGVRAAVEANVVSRETDVRAVAAKVRLGEADAGIVYATDVRGDAKLELRELPAAAQIAASYELAVLVDEREREPDPQRQAAALALAEFVTSPAGQAILAEHGFGPPRP